MKLKPWDLRRTDWRLRNKDQSVVDNRNSWKTEALYSRLVAIDGETRDSSDIIGPRMTIGGITVFHPPDCVDITAVSAIGCHLSVWSTVGWSV